MATGDVILARMNARFDGEPVMNTLAFVDVGSGASGFSNVAAELWAQLDGAIGPFAGGGVWLTGLSVQYQLLSTDFMDVVPGVAPMVSNLAGGLGTVDDDDAMPPNDALCVTWRSEFKGPSGRGRTYLTGFAEGAANGGYWESGTQGHAEAVANALLAVFGEEGTGTFRFVILHRMAGGEPIIPPEQKPVMGYTVHNEVRSLGRRAVGRRIRRRRVTP